jgi:hypothetical protein
MLYKYPYLLLLSSVLISQILVSGHKFGSFCSATLSSHWHIVFFNELAVA